MSCTMSAVYMLTCISVQHNAHHATMTLHRIVLCLTWSLMHLSAVQDKPRSAKFTPKRDCHKQSPTRFPAWYPRASSILTTRPYRRGLQHSPPHHIHSLRVQHRSCTVQIACRPCRLRSHLYGPGRKVGSVCRRRCITRRCGGAGCGGLVCGCV